MSYPTLAEAMRDKEIVERAFFDVLGRLSSIPRKPGKRLVVLARIAGDFEPGHTYAEPEVTTMLQRYHPDHAALRRYLVDEGFLERADGRYWRAETGSAAPTS